MTLNSGKDESTEIRHRASRGLIILPQYTTSTIKLFAYLWLAQYNKMLCFCIFSL